MRSDVPTEVMPEINLEKLLQEDILDKKGVQAS